MEWNQGKKVIYHDGSEDSVITFDFKQAIHLFLRDSTLMYGDNMVFIGNTPYNSIPKNCSTYSDINISDRYLQIQNYKPLYPNEVKIPIQLYVDKANIDQKGTINFKPLMFTLGW